MKIDVQITQMPTIHPEELRDAVRGSLFESGALIEKEVRQRTPQGVGGTASGLRASMFSEMRETGPRFESITASSLPYADPVEFGRRPGRMPPVKALIPWVERFIILKQGETAAGVAFVIAKAIAARGTQYYRQSPPGARMFAQGGEAALPTIERIFKDRIGEASVRLIRNN